jgi:TRAP-type uncharacterized transport system fused permease subunit
VHVAFALGLVFLLFPTLKRFRHRLMWWDVIFAMMSVAIIAYILYWGDELGDRATAPTLLDQVFGIALIVLILEGCRRSSRGSCRSSFCSSSVTRYSVRICRRPGHTRDTRYLDSWATCT